MNKQQPPRRLLPPRVCLQVGADFLEENVYSQADIERFLPYLHDTMIRHHYAGRSDLKFLYGMLLLQIGEEEEALEALFFWLKYNRTCPFYWALLGIIFQKDEPSMAISYLCYARMHLPRKSTW